MFCYPANPALEDAIQYKSMVVIDEIGTMELHSIKFRELVSKVLESDKNASLYDQRKWRCLY